jgi:diacylglycerol kinase
MKRFFMSFLDALRGLRVVFNEEPNFRVIIVGAIAALGAAWYFHFSTTEALFILVAIALVVGGEIINTIVEDLCNKVEPAYDPVIGKIKDMAAGFVLVSALCAFLIGAIMISTHI